MNRKQEIFAISALAFSLVMPVSGLAQAPMDHGKMDMAPMASSMTDGEVKKVDRETGKITIKHGDIKPLDMPAMTMVFMVRDKSLLVGVKPGDKISFTALVEGSKMVVTDIQPAR